LDRIIKDLYRCWKSERPGAIRAGIGDDWNRRPDDDEFRGGIGGPTMGFHGGIGGSPMSLMRGSRLFFQRGAAAGTHRPAADATMPLGLIGQRPMPPCRWD